MKHVIIGSSAAATAAAGEIRKRDARAQITMISRDTSFYSRCQLHWVAAGTRTSEQAQFLPANWSAARGVRLLAGVSASHLDAQRKTVTLSNGTTEPYDRLLIATGSRTAYPPIEGLSGPGVFGLRDLGDATALAPRLATAARVAIIGAGLIGCELADALAEAGKSVTLIEAAPWPLPLQLDQSTGAACAALLASRGVAVVCKQMVQSLARNGEGLTLRTRDGETFAADVVVVAAGVKANIELAQEAAAACNRGVLIDEHCRTSAEDIYAAGDVCEFADSLLGAVMPSPIWPCAVRQGRVAGANMAGGEESLANNTGFRASVNLCGVHMVSLGPVARLDAAWRRVESQGTTSRGKAWRRTLYLAGDVLKAAILWGEVTNAGVYAEAILTQRRLANMDAHADSLDAAKRGVAECTI